MTIREMISDDKKAALLAMVEPTVPAVADVHLECGHYRTMGPGDEALARIMGSALCNQCGGVMRDLR